jgi:hypothetical protein
VATVGAGNGEGIMRKKKFRGVLDAVADFVVDSQFIVYRVTSKIRDLKGDVLISRGIMGHLDGREAAVAEFMLYAISLS